VAPGHARIGKQARSAFRRPQVSTSRSIGVTCLYREDLAPSRHATQCSQPTQSALQATTVLTALAELYLPQARICSAAYEIGENSTSASFALQARFILHCN